MTCVIFTPQQRDLLKGVYGTSELNPVPLVNGNFAVGIEVLSDVNFSDIKANLEALPIQELMEQDFLTS